LDGKSAGRVRQQRTGGCDEVSFRKKSFNDGVPILGTEILGEKPLLYKRDRPGHLSFQKKKIIPVVHTSPQYAFPGLPAFFRQFTIRTDLFPKCLHNRRVLYI